MTTFIIDGYKFIDRQASYEYLDEVFDFPEYFGKNLDALWDVLSDYHDIKIVILDARQIPKNLNGYGIKILDILGDLNGIRGNEVEFIW